MKIRTNVRAGIIAGPRCAPVPRCGGTRLYEY